MRNTKVNHAYRKGTLGRLHPCHLFLLSLSLVCPVLFTSLFAFLLSRVPVVRILHGHLLLPAKRHFPDALVLPGEPARF